MEGPRLSGIGMTSARTRERLVQRLQEQGIVDRRVLDRIRNVPRHLFMDEALASRAYEDTALPIGFGQTISQPYVVARMTEALLTAGETRKVLEIGTGCGYQTAVLARLARVVHSVELNLHLHDRARVILNSMGVNNVHLRCADGSDGWPEEAPFDVVMVTAAMPGIALPLLHQLTPHGRLIAPIGEDELQTLVRISHKTGHWSEEYFGECRFVKMTGKHGFQD